MLLYAALPDRFLDWWGFKHEAYDGSVHAPRILHENGVRVAIKSDDDVVSRYLMFETAKAVHYGLDPEYAIHAVTSVPAAAMGLKNRLGSILPGLDADLVVWDRHPLVLGARPDKIVLDGAVVEDRRITGAPAPYPAVSPPLTPGPTCYADGHEQPLACYVVRGVQLWAMVDNRTDPVLNAAIVTVNGNITCAGADCPTPPGLGCREWTLSSPASAVPGFIEAGSHIGQFEIDSEGSTRDGTSDGSGVDGSYGVISAMDGIHQQSRHVSSARKGGVLTAISPPTVGRQLVVGVSTAFHTLTETGFGAQPAFIDHTLVQHRVALHMQFGNGAKAGGLTNSISGQTVALGRLLARASLRRNDTLTPLDAEWPLVQALMGRLPISVDVHGADEILALLRIQRAFPFHLIIQGGAEAYLVAREIAASSHPVAVVLTSRVPPSSFETYRQSDYGLSTLRQAGVRWAIQSASEDNARNLRWEAGWQKEYNGLTTAEALAGITTHVRRAFEIDPRYGTVWAAGLGEIRVGTPANFVVFDGDPLGVESHVQLTAMGMDVECRPMQF